jgi:RimJ/RimL family protein N-acetyltransferase
MLRLVENDPPDLLALSAMLSDQHDLALVWPDARFPFDYDQWRETLTSHAGNKSFFVANDGEVIGHAALLHTDEPEVLAVSYLYIRPDQRGRGFGPELIALLEGEAKKVVGISALRLRVRTYNPRAAHVYAKSGFVPSHRDGTLVIMRKSLAR